MRRYLWLALALAACTRPAEDRVELDRRVGRASIDGFSVAVDDGLAVVRSLEPAALTLWAQAPVFELTLTAEEIADWTLTLRNVLPDAALEVTADGRRLPVELLEQPLPTAQVWGVTLPAGTVRLRVAPPDADDPGPFRFAMMGDIQEAVDHVEDVFDKINETAGVRFVACQGDLTRRGTRSELNELLGKLERLEVPFYTTQGNHEEGSPARHYAGLFGRRNFHFVYRDVHFTFVDTGNATVDPAVYEWLEDWLEAGRDAVHVFFSHYPPIDPVGTRNGSFRSRKEAAKLITRLARGRVDAMFHGHVHSYIAHSLGGIPSYLSGGGGAIPEALDGIGRHFLTVDVTPGVGVHPVGIVRVD